MANNTKDDLEMDKDVRFMESLEDNNKKPEKKERGSLALNKFKRKFDSVVRRR